MLKKVRLHIKSVKEELTAKPPARGSGVPTTALGEAETIEMSTVGTYRDDGTRISITYRENEGSGMENATTVLSFTKNERGVISLQRSGEVRSSMFFEVGRRHASLYITPAMTLQVVVNATLVQNDIEENGLLRLCYGLELQGGMTERVELTVRLQPYFDKPKGMG